MRAASWLTGAALGILTGGATLVAGALALLVLVPGLVWAARERASPLGLGGYLVGLGVGAAGLLALANARCAAFNTSGPGFESSCTAPDAAPYFAVAGVLIVVGAVLSIYVLVLRRPNSALRIGFSDTQRPWPTWPKPPSPNERERMQLRQDPLLLIDRSPLDRVIGVGQAQTSDGVTVECVAIELRGAGGRGLLRTLTPQGHLFSLAAEGAKPTDPVPRLEDDLGTSYTVTMPQWTGGDYTSEMLFRFAPVPPADARRLIIRAPRSYPYGPSRADATDQWWVFDVDLGGR